MLLLIVVATAREASAYADPGTGALIWQMLMAGAVGLLFYWRKLLTRIRGGKKAPRE